MKCLGATVFLEAADYQVQLSVEFPHLQQDLGGKGDSPPLQSDQKRIERWCPRTRSLIVVDFTRN